MRELKNPRYEVKRVQIPLSPGAAAVEVEVIAIESLLFDRCSS
jgi:hypothetical protein